MNKKNKKKKKKIWKILLMFILVLIVILGAINILGKNKTMTFQDFTKNVYDSSLKKEPYLVLIRDSDSAYGKKENGSISKIANNISNKKQILDVDYSKIEDKNKFGFFIDKYGVEVLPAIVLLDGENKVKKVFYPPFDEKIVSSYCNSNLK